MENLQSIKQIIGTSLNRALEKALLVQISKLSPKTCQWVNIRQLRNVASTRSGYFEVADGGTM